MDSLEDNISKVYKLFSEKMCCYLTWENRKCTRLTPDSFSNKAVYNEVLWKIMEQKIEVQVLKKLREENDLSLFPLAQLSADAYLGISEWCKNFTI